MKHLITVVFLMLIAGCNDDKIKEIYRKEFHEAGDSMHVAGDKAMRFIDSKQFDSAFYYGGRADAFGAIEDKMYREMKKHN